MKLACKKQYVLTCLLFLICLFFSNNSRAEFWQDTVHIHMKTNNFNQARKTAISFYRDGSLKRVIMKVVPLGELNKINELIGSSSSDFFEDKIKISNESLANNDYNVDITYFFNKNKILAFLTKNNIRYINSLGDNSLLVIPVYNGQLLEDNEWYKAWSDVVGTHDYLSTIQIPVDISSIDLQRVLDKETSYLNELKAKYEATNVVVAELQPLYADQNIPSGDIVMDSDVVDDSVDNLASAKSDETLEDTDMLKYDVNIYDLSRSEKEKKENVLLNDALAYSVAMGEESAKKLVIKDLDTQGIEVFKVKYKSFVDWVAIYNFFKNQPQVEDIIITEMSNNYTIIKVKFYGSFDKIAMQAKSRNIIIDTADYAIKCKGFCY